MELTQTQHEPDTEQLGSRMYALIAELYPLCRSITGAGVRQTLDILRRYLPLTVTEVPSGTPVFDWQVPNEWTIRDAYIKDPTGRKIVDFQQSNLHVVNYSVPLKQKLSLRELRPHLYTLPEHPDWIPYKTSYYHPNWGFCLSHNQLLTLEEGEYEVCIDSSLTAGHLTYGEFYLPGEVTDEVLISCHVCHPSLCNDNLSGIAVATFLARHLQTAPRRYSYRFLFIPGTIGSITWLARNEANVSRIKHGLVLACVGDAGSSTYKKSRQGDAEIDRAVEHILRHSGQPYETLDFVPYGYDERQFCSPGFNLPVGLFMRSQHGRFAEYHTSADNLEFVRPECLADSLAKCAEVVAVLEGNRRYVNTLPKCEPQLGKRGLYRQIGAPQRGQIDELALLWVLNLSDGSHTLLDIAERAGLPFRKIRDAADALLEPELLREC